MEVVASIPFLLLLLLLSLLSTAVAATELSEVDRDSPPWVTSPLFHSPKVFLQDYREMLNSFKIFIYPYPQSSRHFGYTRKTEPMPAGNYASDSFFFRNLQESEFVTQDPERAHLFLLPFSVLKLRRSVGPLQVPKFVRGYVDTVKKEWPYWNRTHGADHLYATCHDIGDTAVSDTPDLKRHGIQVLCAANVFHRHYIPHKDMSFPQIWPRVGQLPGGLPPHKRNVLAFWSGSQNSRARAILKKTWENDTEILIGGGALHKSVRGKAYFDMFRKTRFCLHAVGFQVHTARIGDAILCGCVPVIIADQYDLPFKGIIDWREFSVIVAESDITQLKDILKGISKEEYAKLFRNVEKVRRFFTWNSPPKPFDLFQATMYELWQRRFVVRASLTT